MDLTAFRNQYAGKSVLYGDQDDQYRGQCVQLVELYMKEVLGVEVPIYPGAADYWERGVPGLNKVTDPQPGDIVVFERAIDPVGNNGHMGIVLSADANGFTSFDTNYGGKIAHDVKHSYRQVLGYLRKEKNIMEEGKVYEELNKRDQRLDADEKNVNDLYGIVDNLNKEVAALKNAPTPVVPSVTPPKPKQSLKAWFKSLRKKG